MPGSQHQRRAGPGWAGPGRATEPFRDLRAVRPQSRRRHWPRTCRRGRLRVVPAPADLAALDDRLRRQHGVVSRRQLADAGVDPRVADRRVASGRWTPLLPEVFLAAPGPPTPGQLAVAALLHGGPCSALTGRTACRLHGLRDVPEGGPVTLLLPHDVRRTAAPWLQVVRTTSTVPRELVGGLVLVERARAVLDVARDGAGLRAVRALVLAAVADGVAPPRVLRAALEAGPRRDSGHCRRALADAEQGAASAPEAEAADLLRPLARRRGLTLLLNPALVLDGVLLGRPDLYLAEAALGVETDSRRHHAAVDDLDATLRRHARFAAAGIRLLHTTPHRTRTRPAELLGEVDAALRAPGRVPPGLVVLPHRWSWEA